MIAPFAGYKSYDENSFFERNRITIVLAALVLAVIAGVALSLCV